MKKIAFFFLSIIFSAEALSESRYQGDLVITRISVSNAGRVTFGTHPRPHNTCNNHSRFLVFDGSTEGGRAMLSTLLSAKVSGAKLQVWYESTTASNLEQCSFNAMSVVTGLGVP